MSGNSGTPQTPIPASGIYQNAFREKCFQLIHAGYNSLSPSTLHNEEEPAVTGELVRAIRDLMDSPGAPLWYDQFAVEDNPPVNVSGKLGKQRSMVDIRFECTNPRPRHRYAIEAKWIGADKTSLGAEKGYLGSEGIHCFLSGKYPIANQQAGMLAYVHSDDVSAWAKKIGDKLKLKRSALFLSGGSNSPVWTQDASQKPFTAFISLHDSPKNASPPLQITHLLLDFT